MLYRDVQRKYLYICPVIFCLGMTGFIFMRNFIPECAFHARTGYYCFGCGGTRAVEALVQGKIIESLRFHVFPLYVASVAAAFWISYMISFVTGGKVWTLRFHPVYCYVLIALVIGHCVVKNCLM